MLYIKVNADLEVLSISKEHPGKLAIKADWHRREDGTRGYGWLNRNDIDDMATAEKLAANCTAWAKGITNWVYLAADRGPGCSPRYDVVRAPAVGDDVSRGFNGDYYPCGKIVSITRRTYRVIVTQLGARRLHFYRNAPDTTWTQAGGTWSLVMGTHDERNPHV